MGRMKDYLMRVSESMGLGGDINDEVIEEAQDRMAQHADFLHDQRKEYGITEAVTLYIKNQGNEDSSRKRPPSGDDEAKEAAPGNGVTAPSK